MVVGSYEMAVLGIDWLVFHEALKPGIPTCMDIFGCYFADFNFSRKDDVGVNLGETLGQATEGALAKTRFQLKRSCDSRDLSFASTLACRPMILLS